MDLIYNTSVRNRGLQISNNNTNDNNIINEKEYNITEIEDKLILNILPNRINPIGENITFNTDVIESFDGTEQRIPLLLEPRNVFTISYSLRYKELQKFNIFMQKNQSNYFYLPVFTEAKELLSDTILNEAEIEIDTFGSRFQYDLDFIIMNKSNNNDYDVFRYFGEDKVNKKLFVGKIFDRVWKKGDWVIPLIKVRFLDRVDKTFPDATDRLSNIQVKFQKDVGNDKVIVDNEITYPKYKDLYLLDKQPNKVTRMTQSWNRKVLDLDYGFGKTYQYDRSDQSFVLYNYNWTLKSLEEIINLKTFFNLIKGRLTSFWFSSNENEITSIDRNYTLVDNFLIIDNIGLNSYYNNKELNIKINFTDGTYILRQVDSIIEIDANQEQLNLDNNFGKSFNSKQIDSINFLYLCRFNNDDFVFNYVNNEFAQIQKNILMEKIGDY